MQAPAQLRNRGTAIVGACERPRVLCTHGEAGYTIVPLNRLSFRRGPGVAAVTLCSAILALGAWLAVRGTGSQPPSLPSPPHARRDLSVAWHIGPSLRELQANFAILRRPATASEHAMLATFTAATNHQPEVPEYVRLAGVVDGVRVYFVVYPIFRHGSFGAVVGYQMMVAANGTGMGYAPGNYLIFPAVIASSDQSGFAQPQAYLSVVPDDVVRVRWRFTCRQKPAEGTCAVADRTVSVPVHGNLAVLPVTTAGAYATVKAATWYRRNGSQTTFTNQNRAVPFHGAPAWPR